MPDISELNGTAINNVAEFDGLTVTEAVVGLAVMAYSVRLLGSTQGVPAYSGDCIRVRESGGDTETDIGFSSGDLDETALAAHCGANDGYVRTWFDQAGTADMQQATKTSQFKIYDGTTGTTTLNSRPILEATENVTSFPSVSVTQSSPWTAMGVSYNQFDYNRRLFTSNDGAIIAARNKTQLSDASGNISISLAHNDAAIISTGVHNGSSSFVRGLSVNASGSTTGTMTGGSMTAISAGASGTLVSSMQEFILWPVAKTSTEYAAIESDMDTYFNVT